MKGNVRLGRIAGIEIDAHWTLLAIAGLIWLSVSAEVLPALAPGYPAVTYGAVGLAMMTLFYGSLLAHELAHSLVAIRRGVGVRRITLWLLGGVSELSGPNRASSDELLITVVGPGTSLALGLLFGALAGVGAAVGVTDLVVAACGWLAAVNLLLGVFNLLPALPLDGGRILHAVLWRITGDQTRATTTAAVVAEVIAYGLAGLGLVVFLLGGGLGGLWFVIIGWFLLSASRGEARSAVERAALAGVTASQVMSSYPVTVPGSITVDEWIDRYVLGDNHSAYPVVDPQHRPVGLVTLDALRRAPGPRRSGAPLTEIMVPLDKVTVLAPDDQLEARLPSMMASGVGRALVLDHGDLVGIVSLSDVARAVQRGALVGGQPRPTG